MLKIHFAGYSPDQRVIPLAFACGLGKPAKYGAILDPYRRLLQQGPKQWQACELRHADVVVYPHFVEQNTTETNRVAGIAKAAGLPCVFFRRGDLASRIRLPYGVLYSVSMFSDQRTECERAMPPIVDDMLSTRGETVTIRPKEDRPSLGFCGNEGNVWWWLRCQVMRKATNLEGMAIRRRAIRSILRCERVTRNFIIRRRFWGGAVGRFHRNINRQQQLREEFVQNMLDTDYTLCVRGAGNFSLRFYETLSAGRIPLFINTRCVLPFDDQIEWHKHCVWVEHSDLDRAGEILADFHASISPEHFEQMQLSNRQLWLQWIRPEAFFRRALESVRFQNCNWEKEESLQNTESEQ